MSTKIAWTNKTWNPILGCTPISPGCQHCYAARFASRGLRPEHRDLARNGRWTGEVRCLPERLDQPCRWRKPRRIFVCSMSDLFHDRVPEDFIDSVFAVAALCPQHIFQVLTKRPERMHSYISGHGLLGGVSGRWISVSLDLNSDETNARRRAYERYSERRLDDVNVWPLPNVWLGVTVENQKAADERIPLLLQTPAAVRFVSCEPLLGSFDLRSFLSVYFPSSSPHARDALPGLDWIIVGGESGPGARPCQVNNIRSIRNDCREAGVACFIKQVGSKPFGPRVDGHPDNVLGEWPLKNRAGADPAEWPPDLRVREYPA